MARVRRDCKGHPVPILDYAGAEVSCVPVPYHAIPACVFSRTNHLASVPGGLSSFYRYWFYRDLEAEQETWTQSFSAAHAVNWESFLFMQC